MDHWAQFIVPAVFVKTRRIPTYSFLSYLYYFIAAVTLISPGLNCNNLIDFSLSIVVMTLIDCRCHKFHGVCNLLLLARLWRRRDNNVAGEFTRFWRPQKLLVIDWNYSEQTSKFLFNNSRKSSIPQRTEWDETVLGKGRNGPIIIGIHQTRILLINNILVWWISV